MRAKEEKNKKKYKNNSKTMSKMAISIYLSVIILNVNGLNVPNKQTKNRVA